MLLLDYVRDEVGMPMRGLHNGVHIGWTTDETKSRRAHVAGASATTIACTNGRVLGYEVTFAVGREKAEEPAGA